MGGGTMLIEESSIGVIKFCIKEVIDVMLGMLNSTISNMGAWVDRRW